MKRLEGQTASLGTHVSVFVLSHRHVSVVHLAEIQRDDV